MQIRLYIAVICLLSATIGGSQSAFSSPSLPLPVVPINIAEIDATYAANYNGMSITAVKTLTALADGEYLDRLDATSMFGEISQSARFKISAKGQLMPLEYRDQRSILGIKRSEEQIFDWDLSQLQYRKGKRNAQMAIQPGLLDIPTHHLQLRRDLAGGRSQFEYPVAARGKRQMYRYIQVTEELLETPMGPLDTVVMERQRDNDSRRTTVWLAPKWDYLLVKLEQIEKKERYTMMLESAAINGRTVTPNSASTEEIL